MAAVPIWEVMEPAMQEVTMEMGPRNPSNPTFHPERP
jgi:hypothetical protein